MTRRILVAEVLVPGNPKAKQRPRVYQGRAVTPATTVQAEREIAWLVKADLLQRQATDAFPDPDHAYALEVRIHECKPIRHQVDGDNVLKLIQDSLNGTVWADDAQVHETHMYIRDRNARNPRTEIAIYRLETHRNGH